jgi:enolase
MPKIKSIKAREILDSRGNPTVEVELFTDISSFLASVPSGASVGKYEAATVGAKQAVKNVNEIINPKLKGKDPRKQKEIDSFLNPARFGADATTGVSLAVARAGAAIQNLRLYEYIKEIFNFQFSIFNLPLPCFNIINGGVHAGNDLDFQEFMIVPQFNQFSKNLQAGSEIYQELKKIIREKYIDLAINVGDEGGFAVPARVPEEALDLILEATKKLGYDNKIKIILDIAASQFFQDGKYETKFGIFNSKELLEYYLGLVKKYSIVGLEDPFSEEDWEGWQLLKSKIKNQKSKILIIGDDLLVTNPKRIREAKEKNACNGAIIKINQIGTLTEAIEAIKLAKSYGWKIMVSHRSGETNDDFISDLAVGISADYIKSGAPARGERVAKYNRLLKIEEEL